MTRITLPLAPMGPRRGLRGMVAAADQLAATAGLNALAQGGSAADAAVATGTAMAVVGPHLCGLGGDVLAMVSAPDSAPQALLSVGRAGSGSDATRMRAEGMATMPLRGDIRSVQVPGAVDGWLALHERYGRLPLGDVLAPAMELADEGFPASIMLALASHLVHALPGAQELCPDGPLEIGQRVRLPGIARTLRAIARDGREAFYNGEFGRGLLALGAGHFAPSDFAATRGGLVRAAAPRGLGARAVDGAATLAGLSHAGLRIRGRGGRPRRQIPTTPTGPISWWSPGGPPVTTVRACSTTAPTATPCCGPNAWPPRRTVSTRGVPHRPTSHREPALRSRASPAWVTGTRPICAHSTATASASR